MRSCGSSHRHSAPPTDHALRSDAGGGVGELSLVLTLQQIGVDFIVFEKVRSLKPLGVGINFQPNAVRALFDLGFSAEELRMFSMPAKEWTLFGLKGQEINLGWAGGV